ncbi:MAG: IMS domain-containing protein [Candidatus Caenarcaniphilales bacterium]|nr:IMS domain-containing protein [Candidatus Caenarcaniphilales bacterium]
MTNLYSDAFNRYFGSGDKAISLSKLEGKLNLAKKIIQKYKNDSKNQNYTSPDILDSQEEFTLFLDVWGNYDKKTVQGRVFDTSITKVSKTQLGNSKKNTKAEAELRDAFFSNSNGSIVVNPTFAQSVTPEKSSVSSNSTTSPQPEVSPNPTTTPLTDTNVKPTSEATQVTTTPASVLSVDSVSELDSKVKTYFNSHKAQFQELGITQPIIDDFANNEFKEGITEIYTLAVKFNESNPPSPKELLASKQYKLQALDALYMILGKDAMNDVKNKVQAALVSSSLDKTQAKEYFNDFMTANASDSKLTSVGRKYNSFGAVWRNKLNKKQIEFFNAQRNAIGAVMKGDNPAGPSVPEKKAAAKAWMEMYSLGIGGRTPQVIPAGNASVKASAPGNASVHKNLPAFAVRWLLEELKMADLGGSEKIKGFLNKITGIVTSEMNPLNNVISEILNLSELERRNLIAGALASSITKITPKGDAGRQINVGIKVATFLDVLFKSLQLTGDQAQQAINKLDKNNLLYTTTLNLAKTDWDKSQNAKGSTAMIIMDELFNTQNNPNGGHSRYPSTLTNMVKDIGNNSFVEVKSPVFKQPNSALLSDDRISKSTIDENTFNSSEDLTEVNAKNLVATWMKAKAGVLDGNTQDNSNNLELVNRFTMGDLKGEFVDGNNVIKSDLGKMVYQNQSIVSIEKFKTEDGGNTFTGVFNIKETRIFADNPLDIENSGTFNENWTVTFAKDSNKWKISEIKREGYVF